MKKLRLVLLLPAALIELSLLAICWAVAMISRSAAARMVAWADRTLPDLRWYIGH